MQTSWHEAYMGLRDRLGLYARAAQWTVCGLSACVDAFTKLAACDAILRAGPAEAQALGAELRRRAEAGIGGEIRVDWPEGPQWADANLPLRTALGGTAAHATRLLTLLGAPALLALDHRGPEQLSVLDPDMLLAQGGRPVRAEEIAPRGGDRLRIYIFEFTAGESFDGIALPRSSRIIVRFHNFGLERDAEFDELSPRLIKHRTGGREGLGAGLGAGVLAGFSALGSGPALDAGLAYARGLARRWTEAGIGVIHEEMAGFDTPEARDRTLEGLTGSVTSIGMSLSEFRGIDPTPPLSEGISRLSERLRRLGERLRVDRICVHADDWAISATRRDAAQEREALMMGCLLASARAAAGRMVVPDALPEAARFDTPHADERHGDWHIVSCPSPHLERPQTTLGLGDTFMAGCLLVLGQERLPEAGRLHDSVA